jgi:hypothetical protein
MKHQGRLRPLAMPAGGIAYVGGFYDYTGSFVVESRDNSRRYRRYAIWSGRNAAHFNLFGNRQLRKVS